MTSKRELRRQAPELVVDGDTSVLWQLLDSIETRLRSASEIMLPALRRTLQGFTRRADIIIRQLSYLHHQKHSDIVGVCRALATLDDNAFGERLAQAGVPVTVQASPLIPALTDPELEAILKAGRDAGARSASWIMLRLPHEVSPLVQDWLAQHYPDRAGRIMARLREMHGGKDYDANWHTRMRGEGPYAQIIAQRFDLAVKKLGLATLSPPMRCDLFRAPKPQGAQLDLF